MVQWHNVFALFITNYLMHGVYSEDQCCDACIGIVGKDLGPFDYDQTVFDQCSAPVNGVQRTCCFSCGTLSAPTYSESIMYDSSGTQPSVKSGEWVKMQWNKVDRVTYVELHKNQKKTITATINDKQAQKKSDYFLICARNEGQLVFRGWGKDSCREATQEQIINVVKGNGTSTCDSNPVPEVTKQQVTEENTCNLNRASYIKNKETGVVECVCAQDWSNPPTCDGLPLWKWAISIGGGVAAVLSIALSVRAFMNNRKKNHDEMYMERYDSTRSRTPKDMESLRIGNEKMVSGENRGQYAPQTPTLGGAPPMYANENRNASHSNASRNGMHYPPHQGEYPPQTPNGGGAPQMIYGDNRGKSASNASRNGMQYAPQPVYQDEYPQYMENRNASGSNASRNGMPYPTAQVAYPDGFIQQSAQPHGPQGGAYDDKSHIDREFTL